MKIFELAMLLCFGASWPFSIWKSYKARAVGSKSITFMLIVLVGYICGIINNIINGVDYVLPFYVLNFILVSIDALLYVRNRRIEREAAQK